MSLLYYHFFLYVCCKQLVLVVSFFYVLLVGTKPDWKVDLKISRTPVNIVLLFEILVLTLYRNLRTLTIYNALKYVITFLISCKNFISIFVFRSREIIYI